MPNLAIIGTGMAGFGAAYRLHQHGVKPTMYDKNSYHGGHTTSFRYDTNFLFDVGPAHFIYDGSAHPGPFSLTTLISQFEVRADQPE